MALDAAQVGEASVQRLGPDDGPALDRFFSELDDYEQLFGQVELSAAVVTYIALPEGKTYDDKYLLGVWQGGRMIGVIDLIVDYPREGTWTVGLLVLDSAQRRRGIGSGVVSWLLREARGQTAELLRIVARPYNMGCATFLSSLGFEVAVRSSDAVVFEKRILGSELPA